MKFKSISWTWSNLFIHAGLKKYNVKQYFYIKLEFSFWVFNLLIFDYNHFFA